MKSGGWAVAAAALEAGAIGVILLVSPGLFGRLILRDELPASGQALGRLTGIALLSLALACWPKPTSGSALALLIYNLLAAVYLSYLGVEGTAMGLLLWPAVILHALLLTLLAADRYVQANVAWDA